MKDKELALTLTIKLWEKLAETTECDRKYKERIYNEMCKKHSINKNLLPSHCFLCDAYYEEPKGMNYEMVSGCTECPLYKSGNGCDTVEDVEGGTIYTNWCNGKKPEEKHYAADVMIKTLKTL